MWASLLVVGSLRYDDYGLRLRSNIYTGSGSSTKSKKLQLRLRTVKHTTLLVFNESAAPNSDEMCFQDVQVALIYSFANGYVSGEHVLMVYEE